MKQLFLLSLFITVFLLPANSQGFIHPGALHTQEDFDRIKAQLDAKETSVVQAYQRLTSNSYSSFNYNPNPQTWIIRGGGSGENYGHAYRDAAAAYQNALRWKISGDVKYADNAIRILNAWSRTCIGIGGDTNGSLASGLYGYEFANAAELMRDYPGWKTEDRQKFKELMLYVFYPRCINFMKHRHGTNPGHYWSNWGLCNALALISIGVFCDDVFIYNQGVSYYKYDLVGNFTDQHDDIIYNSGYNEFLGNLVCGMYEDSRGPLGYLGQMQESGRDQGHALMAVGLAVDICQIGLNQGDDIFAHMNNRLAAGIEYVAAYNSGTSANDLPWTNYSYCDVRCHDGIGWLQGGIGEGGRGAFRPYWDRILGYYEGVQGISMPFSHKMKIKEPVDGGGGQYGGNSGGFDHLGFSSLTCYRPAVARNQAPTTLSPLIIYDGNSYNQSIYSSVPVGSMIKFSPQLPDGVTDTGKWQWDTGDTEKDLEITVNNSSLYRVTYINETGIKSTQLFSVAVRGDCNPDKITPVITVNNVEYNDTIITIIPGTSVTMAANSAMGEGRWKWNTNETSSSITVNNILSERTYRVTFTNQGGRETKLNYHIKLSLIEPSLSVDGKTAQKIDKILINTGQNVELKPIVQSGKDNGKWKWSNGSTTQNLLLENIQESQLLSVNYTYNDEVYTLDFIIYVNIPNKQVDNGDYFIKDASNGKFLTNDGSAIPVFTEFSANEVEAQGWIIQKDGARYKILSKKDMRYVNEYAVFGTNPYYTAWNTYTFHGVQGMDLYAIQNGGSSGTDYWVINGNIIAGKGSSAKTDFLFEIIPYKDFTDIDNIDIPGNQVYPNPVSDYLIINVAENVNSNCTFTMFTIEGRKAMTVICNAGENTVSVIGLPKGLYIGILKTDNKHEAFKIRVF